MSERSQVGIPKPLADDIRKIMGALGYRSLSEFVIDATRRLLPIKRMEYDRKMAEEEERIVKKHEEGEESIEKQW